VRAILDRYERGDPAGRYYLIGIGTGLSWANANLFRDHKPRLFCVPEKVTLAPEQELDILKRYVQRNPNLADKQVGAVLLLALIDAFPCVPEQPKQDAAPEQQSQATAELIKRWYDANSRCRGGSGDSSATEAACRERDGYDELLSALGQCYGRKGQIGAEMKWHFCGPDSLQLH
jgi:hypothetical protein